MRGTWLALACGLTAAAPGAALDTDDPSEARAFLEARAPFAIARIDQVQLADIDGDGERDDALIQYRPADTLLTLVDVWIARREGDVLAYREEVEGAARYDIVEATEGAGYLVRWSVEGSGRFLGYEAFRYRPSASFAPLQISRPVGLEHADGLIFFGRGEAYIRDVGREWRLVFDGDRARLEPAETAELGGLVRVLEIVSPTEVTFDGAPVAVRSRCSADEDDPSVESPSPDACPGAGEAGARIAIELHEALLIRNHVALPRVAVDRDRASDARVIEAALGPSRLVRPLREGEGLIELHWPGAWIMHITVEVRPIGDAG